jgi:endonuclease/exonuclease/phosphatase family metal-dependent hydrolase
VVLTIRGKRVCTVNCNGKRLNPDLVSFLQENLFDILCLQEVTETIFFAIKAACGYTHAVWAPVQDLLKESTDETFEPLGLAILSNVPPLNVRRNYFGDFALETVLKREEPENREPLHNVVHALLLTAECYGVTVATIHAPWTKAGTFTRFQQFAAQRVNVMLSDISGPLLLCGDLNAPRGRGGYEIYGRDLEDAVPVDVQCSLDATHYGAAGAATSAPPQVMVDTIMTRNLRITDFQVHSGISDHVGFSGTVA